MVTRIMCASDIDADEVIALITSVWEEHGKTGLLQEMPELQAPSSHYVARRGQFWVAREDTTDKIVGTVAVLPDYDRGTYELQKLYVHPHARRCGLGGELCGAVESEAFSRGFSCYSILELWSDVKLHAAHQLYLRRGFIEGGVKTYPSGTTRQHFFKVLP